MEIFILAPIFIAFMPFVLIFFILVLLIPAQLIEEHYRLKRLKLGYENPIIEENEVEIELETEIEDELETVLYSLIEDSDKILYCLECQRVFIETPSETCSNFCKCTHSSYYTFNEIKKIVNEHEDYKRYSYDDQVSYYTQLGSALEVYEKYEKFNEILGRYLEEED